MIIAQILHLFLLFQGQFCKLPLLRVIFNRKVGEVCYAIRSMTPSNSNPDLRSDSPTRLALLYTPRVSSCFVLWLAVLSFTSRGPCVCRCACVERRYKQLGVPFLYYMPYWCMDNNTARTPKWEFLTQADCGWECEFTFVRGAQSEAFHTELFEKYAQYSTVLQYSTVQQSATCLLVFSIFLSPFIQS
jgi:hypothetical protein